MRQAEFIFVTAYQYSANSIEFFLYCVSGEGVMITRLTLTSSPMVIRIPDYPIKHTVPDM